MRRTSLLIALVLAAILGFSQQVETARFERGRWGDGSAFHFESFQKDGGLVVYATDKTDEDNNRLWDFIRLDTSLYELRSDLIPLPGRMSLLGSGSSRQWAAFVFVGDTKHRSDSVPLAVVTYHRTDQSYATFFDVLPDRSTPLSVAVLNSTLMLAVNSKDGKGFLTQYNLDSHVQRTITPMMDDDMVLFQFSAIPERQRFVLAARGFVEKRYKYTAFFVYTENGTLLQTHRFDNGENAALGRMCFGFDDAGQLVVYATLERERNKKVDVEGVTRDFDRMAVGVTWVKFATTGTLSKTFLFKNLPNIDKALTASDRLKVKEELLKMQRGKKKEKGEITFQFLSPRLVDFGGNHVFVAEAFQPLFHTETRMDYYGYYRAYPMYYTVFDGYDFFSEILMAFDDEGELLWHQAVRFENDLSDELFAHAFEAVAHDELVVVSPRRNVLRYEVFDVDGASLLDQHSLTMDYLHADDSFEDEYNMGVIHWFGDRFLVHGCQIVRNPSLRVTRRGVYYVQKVEYE